MALDLVFAAHPARTRKLKFRRSSFPRLCRKTSNPMTRALTKRRTLCVSAIAFTFVCGVTYCHFAARYRSFFGTYIAVAHAVEPPGGSSVSKLILRPDGVGVYYRP